MASAGAVSPAAVSSAAAAASAAVALAELGGRVAISTRALERTVTAIAASRLGVSSSDVKIRLMDDAGLLSVAVSAPVRMPPLRANTSGETLPARVLAARAGIREDITRIAGAHVGTVGVTVTRVNLEVERRVR